MSTERRRDADGSHVTADNGTAQKTTTHSSARDEEMEESMMHRGGENMGT